MAVATRERAVPVSVAVRLSTVSMCVRAASTGENCGEVIPICVAETLRWACAEARGATTSGVPSD